MESKLTQQQELFCLAYTSKGSTFSNITKSYAEGYGIELPLRDDGDIDTRSELYNQCSANGSRLMRDDKIEKRIQGIFIEKFNDNDFWDAKLVEVASKSSGSDIISASRHRNDLKQRITKKIDVTTAGRPLQGLSDDELEALTS